MAEKSSRFEISLTDLANFYQIDSLELKKDLQALTGHPWSSPSVPSAVVRKLNKKKGINLAASITSFQMLKGGVAKTTTALNFGLRASMFGARVLFIDLDQQANLSFSLGFEDEEAPVWVDIVEKKKSIEETVVRIDDGIDLIPSSLNNSVLDRVLLNSNRNWAQAVKAPLEKIRHRYDLIVIDTAPALSAINTAVSVACDRVILPVNPDRFSYLGLKKSVEELKLIQDDFKVQFELKVLFTKFDAREKQSHEIWEKCQSEFSDLLLKSYIRNSAEVKNTIRAEKNLFQSKTPVKQDFDTLTKDLMGIEV